LAKSTTSPIAFNHPVYLSEKEICDELEICFKGQDFNSHEFFRELSVGHCRLDFVAFYEKNIEIIEVKITANFDSVRQVIFYKKIVEEYLRLSFCEHNTTIHNVVISIFARYFDSEIIDLCHELGISLIKVSFDQNKKIRPLTFIEQEYFPAVIPDENFQNILLKKYRGQDVKAIH